MTFVHNKNKMSFEQQMNKLKKSLNKVLFSAVVLLNVVRLIINLMSLFVKLTFPDASVFSTLMLMDARHLQYPHIFHTCPAGIRLLILDSVSGLRYPLSIAGPHLPSHPISPSLLQAIVPD